MKQTLLSFATLLTAILLPAVAHATNVLVDGIYYEIDYPRGGEACVARSQGQTSSDIGTVIQTITGAVNIASEVTYNGVTYPVTAVGSAAFYGKTDITSVTFPSSVNYIDSWAFNGCSGLTSIALPEDGKDIVIAGGAFRGCTGLTELNVPGSVKTLSASTNAPTSRR